MNQSIPIISRTHEKIKEYICYGDGVFWKSEIVPEPRTLFNISLALVESIHPPRGWK